MRGRAKLPPSAQSSHDLCPDRWCPSRVLLVTSDDLGQGFVGDVVGHEICARPPVSSTQVVLQQQQADVAGAITLREGVGYVGPGARFGRLSDHKMATVAVLKSPAASPAQRLVDPRQRPEMTIY